MEQYQQQIAACLPLDQPVGTVSPESLTLLTEAADLYTDDFLAGFTLPDCPAFDEWQFFQTESLRQSLGRVLACLAQSYRARGEFEQAIPCARRWLALEPLHEPAHQLLMQLYAWTDQQAAALRQYDECVRLLADELGISPAAETSELYETIRLKRMAPPETRLIAKAGVKPEPHRPEPGPFLPPALVARQTEWAKLQQAWQKAHRSRVHMVVIKGEAGIGKTEYGFYFTGTGRYGSDPDNLFAVPAEIDSMVNIPICLRPTS